MAGVSKTGVDAAGGGVVGAHGAAGTSGPIGARRISARRDAAHVNHGLLHRGPVGIAMLAVAALMISSCARTASATHTHGESHLGASAVSSARGRVLPAPQAPGPRPKASELESVSCASTQSCVAVGIRAGGGALSFTTTDAGATWKQGALPRGAGALDSVQCMSSSRCVATGEGALLVSTDAGATWQTAADPVPSADLASVVCPTSQVCIAAGLYARATTGTAAVIIESADGGETWHPSQAPVWAPGVVSLGCGSVDFCVAGGDVMLVSYDAGASWQARTVIGGVLAAPSALSCESATACLAAGPNPAGVQDPSLAGVLISATSSAAPFSNLQLPRGTSGVSALSCVAATSVCFAAAPPRGSGASGIFLTSTTSGATWSVLPLPGELTAVSGLSCTTATTCVLSGATATGAAVASTSDAGSAWNITSTT